MIANPVISVEMEESSGVGIAKRTSSLLGAGAVTIGLLFIMTQLINNEMPKLESVKQIVIPAFVPAPVDETVEVIKIKRPVVKEAPVIDVKSTFVDRSLGDDFSPGHGTTIFDPEPQITATVGLPSGMALIPISPQFPERAAQMGLCGQVMVQFDIASDGVPVNVAIIESSHRVFNTNAVKAVQRSRYKPAGKGEQGPIVLGKREKITFKLDGGC